MKNKIIIIIICVVFVLLLCVVGYSVINQKPKVTLNIKTPTIVMNSVADADITDAYTFLQKAADMFKKEYKDADVTINLAQLEQTRVEELQEAFDTPDAVDVFYREFFNMSTYIHTGRVVPLDDIITEDIRNDIDNSYWELSSLQGKTYMIPYLAYQNTLCYNKDLFRQVGLDKYVSDEDIIQNWALEEWEEILYTLQKKLPENIFPMLMYAKDYTGDTHIMTLLRSHGSTFFDENGRIKLNTKEGIEAIKWLMDYNEKGYFPENSENLQINDCSTLFHNGQLAIFMNNIALNPGVISDGIDVGNVNFPTINGDGLSTTFITGFEVFDNGDKEKLKVAKDFVKFIYETDELIDLSAGQIPCSNKVYEKYKDELEEVTKYKLNSKNGWDFTANNPNWRGVREVFYKNIKDLLYGEMSAEEIAKQIEETCNKEIEKGYQLKKVKKEV